ncbi:MAG: FAD-dependent oxidoreductase [Curvibacter sp.]|nr:FAD-dependent oxidoreductase [Curvibacter sp.]
MTLEKPSCARVAVIGSGISGLAAAWALRHEAALTLFEADARAGGHAHTVDITLDGQCFGVDTGFLVCNHRTYPGLMGLFRELGVTLTPAQMGFSVQLRPQGGRSSLEWAGTGLRGLLAQPRQALSPRFLSMLGDILRFNRLANALAEGGQSSGESTAAFLVRHGFGAAFRDHYLVPMVACIWSCSTRQMMDFPIDTLIRFCHNHGLLQVVGQPPWYSVRGGSRQYVQRLLAGLGELRLGCAVQQLHPGAHGVAVRSAAGLEHFDAVVLATHSDQALRLLGDAASPLQREVLGAIRYQPNRAVLHTDTRLMPERRAAWAAWNFETHQTLSGPVAERRDEEPRVCLHYWLNALQELPTRQPVLVSLNPLREPQPSRVLAEFEYAHPIFDAAAVAAQQRLPALDAESGRSGLWLAGAWRRYGFHEDGLQSGLLAAEGLRRRLALSPARRVAA